MARPHRIAALVVLGLAVLILLVRHDGFGGHEKPVPPASSTHATPQQPRAEAPATNPEAHGEARGKPGNFDYYALVLSWSPTYCESQHGRRSATECAPSHARGFILHGLWPQYERGWPSNCHLSERPFVPNEVIAAMRPIMPDKSLVIHEYRTHGTCSGLGPRDYFATARALFQKVAIPPSLRDPQASVLSSPEKIEQQFLAANDWLRPGMIAVSCRGRNLLDVRLCFGKDLGPRACGANENQRQLCSAPAIGVPAPGQ